MASSGTDTRSVVTPHGVVPLRSWSNGSRPVGWLIAHGAGAGHGHPWIRSLCVRLSACGYPTWSFEYAYMAAGRRAPDRLSKLLDVHEAVAATVRPEVDALVLAGKSMGGRVGGHLVADGRSEASGLAYLGYPLVPIGKDEPRDTSHLQHVGVPQLFVSGTRDRMGPLALIESVVRELPDARLVTIEDGDHSLKPRVATGRTLDDALDDAVASLDAWVDEVIARS